MKTLFNEKFKLQRHLTAIFLPVVRQNARVTKSHKYRKIHVNFKFATTVYVRTLINVNVNFSFNL